MADSLSAPQDPAPQDPAPQDPPQQDPAPQDPAQQDPFAHVPEDRLWAEIRALQDEARQRARLADRRAQAWAVIDVALGFPAALLAGISGAAGLATADARVPAAVLALVAAGFSAGAGFLRSDERRLANKRARQAWAAVDARARFVLAQESHLDAAAVRQELGALFERRQTALAAYEGDVMTGLQGGS